MTVPLGKSWVGRHFQDTTTFGHNHTRDPAPNIALALYIYLIMQIILQHAGPVIMQLLTNTY